MPPTILPYDGPLHTVRPSAVTLVAVNMGGVTNPSNLTADDGSNTSFALPIDPSGGDPGITDKYRLTIGSPSGQLTARIRSWRAVLEDVAVSATGGPVVTAVVGMKLRPVDNTNTERGGAFFWHEIPAGPSAEFDLQDEYGDNGFVIMAEGQWTFECGGGTATQQHCDRFSTFVGFNFWAEQEQPTDPITTTEQTWSIDGIFFEIPYTPVDPGSSIKALSLVDPSTVEHITEVTGASLGVAADPDWGSELAWDDATRADTLNTTFATSTDVMGGATYAQTRFLRGRFAAGALSDTTGKVGVEFRVPMMMYASPNVDGSVPADPDEAGWASVGEAVLLNLDGDILAKASDNWLYGLNTYKMGATNSGQVQSQRTYDACIDISGLTANQLADLETRGGRFAVRYNVYAPQNGIGDTGATTVQVNCFSRTGTGNSPTISLNNGTPPPEPETGVSLRCARTARTRRTRRT